jgi:predicted dehydrogenase
MSRPARSLSIEPARLAFVGLGWIGRMRLDALASDPALSLAACVDVDMDLARRIAASHAGAKPLDSLQAALDLDIDGVVLATPTGMHEAQALAALERGVAVFCQKPLAATSAGAERVIASAARANRLLGVDFCYRHVNGMAQLRERLAAHAYGEILSVDLTFHNAYAPSAGWSRDPQLAGGGCLLDLGVHLLDLLAWLQDFPSFEVESARLFAQGRERAPGVRTPEDLVFAQLRQDDGACVRLACSWNLHLGQGAAIEVAIRGTRGGAHWRNVAGSFFDFELSENRGDQREVLARGPDPWGPRALREWIGQLSQGRGFDDSALGFIASAELVDAIYARGDRA